MNRAFDHSKYQNWIDPNDVKPYERNAKIHDEKQIANIAKSIEKFGWQQDTVITRDGVLVIGHGRRLAALKLGCEMPYHVVDKDADELTDEDILELRLADNKTNESPWDFELLGADLKELAEPFDMIDFGFGDFEITMLTEDMEPEKFDNELLDKYSHGDEFLKKKRIIISFTEEQEETVKKLLGLEELEKIVYQAEEIPSLIEMLK